MRFALACTLVATSAYAQSQIQLFLDELNRAFENGDRAAIVAAVQYPVTVAVAGVRVPFQSADALLERFDQVFTPELRAAVARGPASVTESPDGFLVGENALAIGRAGGRLKITAIVIPPPEPPSPISGTAPTGPFEPRRIGLRAGPRPTRFAGSLPAGAIDAYVLFVPKGQLLDVRLERVRGEAVVRVVNAATGTPLNARVASGALVVVGRAPADADYRIDVQRTSTGDAALPYLLSVSVR